MGTSYCLNVLRPRGRDHPHAYGDKRLLTDSLPREKGSSPRVWGQVYWQHLDSKYYRIIPTRMGTRIKSCCICHRVKDHPHAYGDKRFIKHKEKFAVGSSPRVWGQEAHSRKLDLHKRIIPTRMGTSAHQPPLPVMGEDHPHAYGDKTALSSAVSVSTGSSPRVWGQVRRP